MAFFIQPFPGQTYPAQYANHNDIRAYLGYGKLVERELRTFKGDERYMTLQSRKLDFDAQGECEVPLTDGRTTLLNLAYGRPSSTGLAGKSSSHRCTVQCPDCKKWVPAGRTHQHKCK